MLAQFPGFGEIVWGGKKQSISKKMRSTFWWEKETGEGFGLEAEVEWRNCRGNVRKHYSRLQSGSVLTFLKKGELLFIYFEVSDCFL